MAERSKQPPGNPEGFEVVSFAIPPDPRVAPNVLPTRAAHHDLIIRLAGKIIGDAEYSEPFWSEQDGEEVKTRERTVPIPGPSVNYTVREKHEAAAEEPGSLKRIYGTDGGVGTTMERGQIIRPLMVSVYDARERTAWGVVLEDLPASTPQEDLFDIADMEIAGGDVRQNTPIARHSLYLGLAFGAHELPPLVQEFKGYKNFRA